MKQIRIGSRESLLAIAQTQKVVEKIQETVKEAEVSIVTMKTTGDRILDRTLKSVGGKGLFVKELDQALLDGRCDITVHSMKDIPAILDESLPLLGYLEGEDYQDVLVLPQGNSMPKLSEGEHGWEEARALILEHLDTKKPIGTSSERRKKQLELLFPELEIRPIRGNVNTRLEKLDQGEYGALILASAGLKRLGLSERITYSFELEQMIPAVGQGVIAVQGKAGNDFSSLAPIFSEKTRKRMICERSFIQTLQGGCSTPIGVYAKETQNEMHVFGYYYNEETKKQARKEMILSEMDDDSLRKGGQILARQLLKDTV